MGAWGEKPFENDGALDFLTELEENGVEELRRALSVAAEAEEGDYLDVDDGSAAIAAAEIVASKVAADPDRLSKPAMVWLLAHAKEIGSEDIALAIRAVKRVAGPASELSELWGEGGGTDWKADLDSMLARLTS